MRILIAHPQRLMAESLASALESEPNEILGTCYSKEQAEEMTRRYKPEVVISSSYFEDGQGPEIVASIKAGYENAAIVIVSGATGNGEYLWALQAGAAGYVGLDSSRDELVEAIAKVAKGDVVICGVDQKTTTAATDTNVDPEKVAALVNLTPREREVLEQLSRGFSNRQIATNLYLSEHTVRTHVQNLRSKLNVRSKFQAAVLAMQASSLKTTVPTGGFRL